MSNASPALLRKSHYGGLIPGPMLDGMRPALLVCSACGVILCFQIEIGEAVRDGYSRDWLRAHRNDPERDLQAEYDALMEHQCSPS